MVAFPWSTTFDLENATAAVNVQTHMHDHVGNMGLDQGRDLMLDVVICCRHWVGRNDQLYWPAVWTQYLGWQPTSYFPRWVY